MPANKGVPPNAEKYVKMVDDFMSKYPSMCMYGTFVLLLICMNTTIISCDSSRWIP